MAFEADILENEIRDQFPEVLNLLLLDQTTNKNIFWATDNYLDLGPEYDYNQPISPDLITGKNGNVIMPRVKKEKRFQQIRARNMAEVFTPSWICNVQNNEIDNAWFGKENIFNYEKHDEDGNSWEVNFEPIIFPEKRDWKDYIKENRLEVSCGEAPYVTSRYDTTNGHFIPIESRVGLLDRKFRVINENVNSNKKWIKSVLIAYKSIYAFEWQGDSLLLAREALLYTFLENYLHKFNSMPDKKIVIQIATIISWNIWQMDGIKGVIPGSCNDETEVQLFGIQSKNPCKGCQNDNIKLHNGIYCKIMDWEKIKSAKNRNADIIEFGNSVRFIDLLTK